MRQSFERQLFTILTTAAILGCAAGRAAAPNAATDANGTWSELGEVPGSSEQWTLSVSGGSVAGTGTWTGEACCAGGITISGSARADSLHLDLVYSKSAPPPGTAVYFTEHVDAVLTSPTDLVGTAQRPDGFSGTVHFVKGETVFLVIPR